MPPKPCLTYQTAGAFCKTWFRDASGGWDRPTSDEPRIRFRDAERAMLFGEQVRAAFPHTVRQPGEAAETSKPEILGERRYAANSW